MPRAGSGAALGVASRLPAPTFHARGRDVAWTSLEARVLRNGDVVKKTRGGHPLGNVLVLLPWLARHAAARGMPLEEGDLVTAGTWTGVVEAFPGDTIDVEFPAIGRASARFE